MPNNQSKQMICDRCKHPQVCKWKDELPKEINRVKNTGAAFDSPSYPFITRCHIQCTYFDSKTPEVAIGSDIEVVIASSN